MKTPDLKAWLNARANRPLTLPSQIRVLRATFRTESDAELAVQLLGVTAVATSRDETTIRVIYQAAPDQKQDLKMQARLVRQTLSDAGIDPVQASFSPAPVLDKHRTWHRTASVRRWPTKDDRDAMRLRPELVLVDAIGPRHQANLKLTDESELSELPAPHVVVLLAAGLLLILTMVELSGTDRLFSWLVGVGLALSVLAGIAAVLSSHSWKERWGTAGFSVLMVAMAYGLGLLQARNAPDHLSWTGFAAAAIALGLYVGAATGVVVWLRSNPTLSRRVGAVLAAAGAALLASGVAPEIVRAHFEHGLGTGTTPIEVPTLDLLWALRDQVFSSILLIVVVGVGVALINHGATPMPRVVRHLLALVSITMTATAFLLIAQGAYILGDSIRRGDLTDAEGIASCAYIEAGQAPVPRSQPVVIVGPVSGPSLVISRNGDRTLVSDGLTVRQARSTDACAQPTASH